MSDLPWQLAVAIGVAAIVIYEVAARLLKRGRALPLRSASVRRARVDSTAEKASAIVMRIPFGLAAEPRPAVEDSRGKPRFLCECCGYPTGGWSLAAACCICDFAGAMPLDLTVQVIPEDGWRVLEVAKANFQQYGSVYTPDERAESGGPLTKRELDLRAHLQQHFTYLLATPDPPDATERWEAVDQLRDALRTAEQRRLQGGFASND